MCQCGYRRQEVSSFYTSLGFQLPGIDTVSSIFIFDHRNSDKYDSDLRKLRVVILLEADMTVRIPPKPNMLCTDIDYKGVVYGTQLAIHFMRKNKVPGGNIVATASVAAVVPHESYPEYDGAKAAVRVRDA